MPTFANEALIRSLNTRETNLEQSRDSRESEAPLRQQVLARGRACGAVTSTSLLVTQRQTAC